MFRGRVAFLVGPLLIAETEVAVQVINHTPKAEVHGSPRYGEATDETFLKETSSETSSEAYRAIFVSYSHEDSAIVEQLEKAYTAIGDSYLRRQDLTVNGV